MLLWFGNKKLTEWGRALCCKALESLSSEYSRYEEQLKEGIIKRLIPGLGTIPNFYGISYNANVSDKYELHSERNFALKHFVIRDSKGKLHILDIYFAYGLINGFAIGSKVEISGTEVIIKQVRKCFLGESVPREIQSLGELYPQINASDAYRVAIGDSVIYHIKDIGDGDFLGYDLMRGFVKVCHDPVSVEFVDNIFDFI